MRNMRLCMVLAAAACLTSSAVAWEAIAWGGSGTGWEATAEHGIQINAPGSYKFYATTGGSGGQLAEITNIFCNGNISAGTVTVSIVRNPDTGGGAGCTYLGQMDLTAATASNVPELRVEGDAATVDALSFGTLSGPLIAGGDIDHGVNITLVTTAGNLTTTGTIAGPVAITTLNGDIACAGLGNLTVGAVNTTASINVSGNYAATMTINGQQSFGALTLGGVSGTVTSNVNAGIVTINGDVSGTLDLIGFSGSANGIVINGAITSTGSVITHKIVDDIIDVSGDIAGLLDVRAGVGAPRRLVHCQGNVSGTLNLDEIGDNILGAVQIDGDLLGALHVSGTLNTQAGLGQVRVLGALGAGPNAPGVITVGGIQVQSPYSAFICINYDGLDCPNAGDLWYDGSTITVGAIEYSDPNNNARVHAVPPSGGPGDCDGDGAVTFSDIDPFVTLLGLNSTNMPAFHTAHLFMADTNRDGTVGFPDIDSFVELLGTVYCQEQLVMMAASASASFGDGTDPQTVASYLAANISAGNYDTLLDAVDYVATFPPVEPSTDWAQVAALLSGE